MAEKDTVVASVVAVVATPKRAARKAGKRSNGEGTIVAVKDKAGKTVGYRVAVSTGESDAKGRPQRVWRRAKTKEEAVRLKQEMNAEAAAGDLAPRAADTLAGFLARWLETSVRPAKAESTARMYADATRLHIAPALGRKRVKDLTTLDVQRLLNRLATTKKAERVYAKPEMPRRERTLSTPGPKPKPRASAPAPAEPETYSRRTVEVVRAVLRAALSEAVRSRLVTYNVVKGTTMPREARRPEPRRSLDLEGARRLLEEAARDALYGPAVVVMLGTGARVSEALGLRWRDADLAAGRLTVAGTLARPKGGGAHWSPATKTGKVRTLHPPALVMDALREMDARRLLGEHPEHPDGLILLNRAGAPLDPSAVNKRLKAMAARAGIGHVSAHVLRHTFATITLAATKDLRPLSDAMGHATTKLTSDLYGHVLEDAAVRTGRAIGEALTGRVAGGSG